MQAVSRRIGLVVIHFASLFPCSRKRCSTVLPSLERINSLESSFPSACSSSEFLRLEHRSGSFDLSLPTRGFGPLRDVTDLRPPFCGELPTPRFVPSSGFLNLATVCSASWLAGLFQPAAAFRTLPVQGLLSRRLRNFLSEARAPLPLSASSSSVARCPLERRLGFEALFCAEQRFVVEFFRFVERSLPSSGFHAPPG